MEPGMHNIDFKQCYKLGLEKELFVCLFLHLVYFLCFLKIKFFENKVLMSDFVFAIL